MGGKVWAIIKVNKFTTGISLVVLTNIYQQGKSQSRVNRVKFMQNVGLEENSSGIFLSRKSGWKAQNEACRWEVCGPMLILLEKDPRWLKC